MTTQAVAGIYYRKWRKEFSLREVFGNKPRSITTKTEMVSTWCKNDANWSKHCTMEQSTYTSTETEENEKLTLSLLASCFSTFCFFRTSWSSL